MDHRAMYRAAALYLKEFVRNEAALCECLALLQQIPEAGPIFSAVDKAEVSLTHALQFLYHKGEGSAAFFEPSAEGYGPAPVQQSVELPASLAKRWSWRPPGENPA